MKRIIIINLCLVFTCTFSVAQDSDNQYKKTLRETLEKVEKQFDVTLYYSENLVKDKIVTYADWRFRSDVEQTLSLILGVFDYTYFKEGENTYRIEAYRYSKRPPEEGKKYLGQLLDLYPDSVSWQKRKQELRECIVNTLHLSPLPVKPDSGPIITNERKMDGYGIRNIAIETLPGFYVCGSLYKPAKIKGKVPVILSPNGHGSAGRYHESVQARCAVLAKMGAMVFNYDMFAYGESQLQFNPECHRRSLAMSLQLLNSIKILDYLLSLKDADREKVGMTGASGGGTQTMLVTAVDDRIKVSVPVVMTSSWFYGGCPCESGMPVHLCGGGTNNAEIAAMAAPRPQLVISDGGDWTAHVPDIEFPYLKKVYALLGEENLVTNIHLENEGHDYGISKRVAMYDFMARHLDLDIGKVKDREGKVDESFVTIEKPVAMKVFGVDGKNLPKKAIRGFSNLEKIFYKKTNSPFPSGEYKIAVCDWMILKRQKLGAFERTKEIGADGLELDMGGLGNRPTFDNKLLDPVHRKIFLDKSKETGVEIASIAMSGFYAQDFATRETVPQMVDDCINTMLLVGAKVAFLPLGVQGDLIKYPEKRDAIVGRLKVAGEKAEAAGVIIGIETSLSASEEVELLEEIGSPAIKIYFNFQNPLEAGRDLYKELKILGEGRICQIHATDTDGVLLEKNTRIEMQKVKEILDEMGWSGWLVIERSRDASNTRDVVGNYGANTRYLKSVFQNK